MSTTVIFESFFKHTMLNTNAYIIKGVRCGYRLNDIKIELTKRPRYLVEIVNKLAKGRKIENILRTLKMQ